MSANETSAPTPRMRIYPAAAGPPPIWTGVKFTCAKCKGEFQLEAADQCKRRFVVNDHLRTYNTPRCPTPGCGNINIILVPSEKSASSAVETQGANAS
jgi:hypothetical protein